MIASIIYIFIITLLGVLTMIDFIKCFKSRKMIDKAIDNCFKAIKEKEVK